MVLVCASFVMQIALQSAAKSLEWLKRNDKKIMPRENTCAECPSKKEWTGFFFLDFRTLHLLHLTFLYIWIPLSANLHWLFAYSKL